MRLIGTLSNETDAESFSRFLRQSGIAHHVDKDKNLDWGDPSYGHISAKVWVENEDDVETATQYLEQYIHDKETLPKTPQCENPPPLPPQATQKEGEAASWERQPMGWITRLLLFACIFLFSLSEFTIASSEKNGSASGLIALSSPVEKAFLFDYPLLYERIDRFIQTFGITEFEHPSSLTPEAKRAMKKIQQTPAWPGYYQLLLTKGWNGVMSGLEDYPTFEKIKEGQLWRFFSPIFLHGDVFHIFFNMLWLIVLGKQIEARLSPFRYISLILILAAFSNTAQYLMSGANFIGFSGVLCGMLAFLWVRQREAPWEGYRMDKATVVFMLLFVIGMAALQLSSFVLEKTTNISFAPNIANMAHFSGGLLGLFLGKINFFAWRQR